MTPLAEPSERSVAPLVALLSAQSVLVALTLAVFDDLRVDPEATFANTFGQPQHVAALVAPLIAAVLVARGSRRSLVVARVVAWLEIVGFAFAHALPVQIGSTEPYWGDGSADALQWIGLMAVLACAGAVLAAARAAPSPSSSRKKIAPDQTEIKQRAPAGA
jgi:hypothetical protein